MRSTKGRHVAESCGAAVWESSKFLPFLLFLATVCGCGSLQKASSQAAAKSPYVAVVKVERRNVVDELKIASEFLPYQEIDAYAKVSGYIKNLYVDWGNHVKQGQPLALLEVPELEQQIEQDEAAVARAQKEMQRSEEELHKDQSAYYVADITYKRLADVQKTNPGLIAQQDIDVAQGKDIEASASVSAAKAALDAAEQSLLSSQAALDKDKAMYAYTQITAPFDGVVTQIYAYTGALLPAGTSANIGNSAVCHLSQNNLLRLVIPIPERAASGIHLGETVTVEVTSLKKIFQGKVARFSGQIDLQTRTMHTEVTVPNPRYEIIPGTYALVRIPLQAAEKVLAVPLPAIEKSGNGQGYVLLIDHENRIERRSVTLGIETATEAEIRSGLEENDLVVFGDSGQYRIGELVSPKLVSLPGMEK